MSEKIHPPTPRRRKQAREQGRAPRSDDLVSAGGVLTATGLLAWRGPSLSQGLLLTFESRLSRPIVTLSLWESFHTICSLLFALGALLLPLLAGILVSAIAFNLVQTGFICALESTCTVCGSPSFAKRSSRRHLFAACPRAFCVVDTQVACHRFGIGRHMESVVPDSRRVDGTSDPKSGYLAVWVWNPLLPPARHNGFRDRVDGLCDRMVAI